MGSILKAGDHFSAAHRRRMRTSNLLEQLNKGIKRLTRGYSVLFVGCTGTGKTMAAEVIASELGLDRYRIDLSAEVSKYIGETEKNLARIIGKFRGGFCAFQGNKVSLLNLAERFTEKSPE
jgi:SpoVK/Ycf46/Vps4 family AAA+-type ATPase